VSSLQKSIKIQRALRSWYPVLTPCWSRDCLKEKSLRFSPALLKSRQLPVKLENVQRWQFFLIIRMLTPIGACIGPRGGRVQEVIEELHGEKIDIFQWNDDLTELVKNALAPAEIEAVLPVEDNGLLVVVNEDQLSLAIGKRGKNARLAVKLTNHKIDIKTKAEIEEMGLDYDKLVADAEAKKAEYKKEAEIKALERKNSEAEEVKNRIQANAAKIAEAKAAQAEIAENEDIVPDEMAETVSENIRTEMAMEHTDEEKAEPASEEVETVEEETEEPAEETAAVSSAGSSVSSSTVSTSSEAGQPFFVSMFHSHFSSDILRNCFSHFIWNNVFILSNLSLWQP